MVFIGGVHLLPATGEFAYDTIPHTGALAGAPQQPLNTFFAPGGTKTDYSYAIDQLQAAHPECSTVSLVVAWFFNSEAAGSCNVYPSTNYPLGTFEQLLGGVWTSANWTVSNLTQADFPGIIPLPALPGTTNSVYGGTPSDPSVVRCIQNLKSRGFKVVFYPFLLGTGQASRGADVSPIRRTSRSRRRPLRTRSSARPPSLSSRRTRQISRSHTLAAFTIGPIAG